MSVISNFVNSNPTLFANVPQASKSVETFESVFAELTKVAETPVEKKKSQREISEAASDAQIKAFFDDMKKAGSAGSYLQKLNQDKIEKLLKEKEEELKEKYGINRKPPLNSEEMASALKAVQEDLEAYKKELMKQLKEKLQEDAKSAKKEGATTSVQADTKKPKVESLADLLAILP